MGAANLLRFPKLYLAQVVDVVDRIMTTGDQAGGRIVSQLVNLCRMDRIFQKDASFAVAVQAFPAVIWFIYMNGDLWAIHILRPHVSKTANLRFVIAVTRVVGVAGKACPAQSDA